MRGRAVAAFLLVPSLALAGLGVVVVDNLQSESGPRKKRDRFVGTTPERALIGEVAVAQTIARVRPGWKAKPVATFPREYFAVEGAGGSTPRVFLLLDSKKHKKLRWYRALLPMRPNGTTGYVPATDLELTKSKYRLKLDRSRFTLTLFRGTRLVRAYPVGIGTGETPTPVGNFYLTSLLQPPDPDTLYGTYAYGLSAFSETLIDWEGRGVVGLHGTNEPESVGVQASQGCIRMLNEHIEELVEKLPLGTPIKIV